MRLDDVMDELATQLDTIPGLRCFAYPADSIAPPAAIVRYPDSIDYDQSYSRGMDTITLSVVVLVGKVSDRASRDAVSAYVAGSGASSVKAVLEAGTYTKFDTIHVPSVNFDVYTVSAVDYLAAVFEVQIFGNGD